MGRGGRESIRKWERERERNRGRERERGSEGGRVFLSVPPLTFPPLTLGDGCLGVVVGVEERHGEHEKRREGGEHGEHDKRPVTETMSNHVRRPHQQRKRPYVTICQHTSAYGINKC